MNLWQTRRHWEKFARTDPLWAVLTHAEKSGNQWDLAPFFETGRHDVAADLAAVRALHPGLRLGHALDFGCGVGRLTQALADHFARVTGVDIAAGMLALARQHNRHGARVSFQHNTRGDLACFADGSFDFVYSLITLQHVPPEAALRYIAEFMRVLAPGGVALFQMPASAPPAPHRRWSFYPPTVWKNFRRGVRRLLVLDPVMKMHAIPRTTVLATLRAAGGEVLDVVRSDAAGADYESYRYLVRR